MDIDTTSDARPPVCVIAAPEDCTEAAGLSTLLKDVRRSLELGQLHQVVDLSHVRRMNARLLATLLVLVREVSRAGGTLRMAGATEEFRRWAQITRILAPLEKRGLIS